MLKRHLVKVLLYVLGLSLGSAICFAEAPKYPSIREWQGSAWVTGKDGKRLQVKSKQVLREKALLETSSSGHLKIQLDPVRSVTLLGGTELSIPVISWDGGEAPVLLLKAGELHWVQDPKVKGSYNVAFRSDLFEFLAPPGNYILSMDPHKAFAGVKMYEGSMEFSALNGEESAVVKSGQQVGFQGVLEGKDIAYDVLLKGKKIPKGHLTPVTEIDSAELEMLASVQKKKIQAQAQKKAAEQVAVDKAKKEGFICANPSGKFNDCSWVCLNNPKKEKKACLVASGATCQRQRCNANGQWAEQILVDAEKAGTKCKAQPVVAPCDY